MGIMDLIRNLDTIIQIIVVAILICLIYRQLQAGKPFMPMVLFMFSMGAYLVSDLYWIAHIILKPGVRVPYDANEIGGSGMFLLLTSTVLAVLRERKLTVSARKRKIILGELAAAAFTVINIALWIGWSGEWLKDILTGMVFGYFLCAVVRSMLLTDALSTREWAVFSANCLLLLFMQAAIFHVPGRWKQILDILCYVLMIAVILGFFVKVLRMLRAESVSNVTTSRSTETMFTLLRHYRLYGR